MGSTLLTRQFGFTYRALYREASRLLDLPQVDPMNFKVEYVRINKTKDFSESLQDYEPKRRDDMNGSNFSQRM